MIQMLKSYYTKAGKIVTPLSFSSGYYNCRYIDGSSVKLKSDELFETNPKKRVKIDSFVPSSSSEEGENIPDFIFYDEKEIPEPIPEIKEVDKISEIQDNIEENADSFYADL